MLYAIFWLAVVAVLLVFTPGALEIMLDVFVMILNMLAVLMIRLYLLIEKLVGLTTRINRRVRGTLGGVLVLILVGLAALVFG